MSLCPICDRMLCDHSPEQRGQTVDEMMAPLDPDEKAVVVARNNGNQDDLCIALEKVHNKRASKQS